MEDNGSNSEKNSFKTYQKTRKEMSVQSCQNHALGLTKGQRFGTTMPNPISCPIFMLVPKLWHCITARAYANAFLHHL